MKKGAFLALVAALAAALLAFAGCGGGDETTVLTKAEFTKQANAGCKEHDKEREQLFREVSKTIDPSEVTRKDQEGLISEVLLPPYEKDIENLESLGAPEGDEQQVEAIIAAMEKSIDNVEAKPLVALRSTSQFAEANELAKKYGLDDCVL
ncbi:MAG TPA: hypothetical protein VFS54_09820 [Solirubrobacterales bacterium]|nr:hypothetical protein [Solirubrobacterales bacterium]